MSSADATSGRSSGPRSGWVELIQKEDWWAVWIGLAILAVAVVLFLFGSSLDWLAVTPAKWSTLSQLGAHFAKNALRYVAQLVVWAALFSVAGGALKIPVLRFLPSFVLVYIASLVIFAVGQWDKAIFYDLEPPLVALVLGLIISNIAKLPAWLESAFRVEFYVKVGIILLGATLPFTLIVWAGPVAIVQAAVVSLATFFTIFLVGRRMGLDRRFLATLGAGGAVCGVSGAIAVAGAVGAKKQDAPIAISLVILWAIVMIFVLPLVSRLLALPMGIAGAWIGTSEFADAAGLAAAQTYAGYAGHVAGIVGKPDAALNAYSLMKVIGRDIWIGIWALVLSIVATTRWEKTEVSGRARGNEIWLRFPKFVIGFLVASLVTTLISQSYSLAAYNSVVVPHLVGPIRNLRTWAFIFCFFSIGLTTRIKDLAKAGAKPFWAFTAGVVVNVVVGFLLSTQVFAGSWLAL